MAIYILPTGGIIDTSKISREDYLAYRQHKKNLYGLAMNKEELVQTFGKVPKSFRDLQEAKKCKQ